MKFATKTCIPLFHSQSNTYVPRKTIHSSSDRRCEAVFSEVCMVYLFWHSIWHFFRHLASECALASGARGWGCRRRRGRRKQLWRNLETLRKLRGISINGGFPKWLVHSGHSEGTTILGHLRISPGAPTTCLAHRRSSQAPTFHEGTATGSERPHNRPSLWRQVSRMPIDQVQKGKRRYNSKLAYNWSEKLRLGTNIFTNNYSFQASDHPFLGRRRNLIFWHCCGGPELSTSEVYVVMPLLVYEQLHL